MSDGEVDGFKLIPVKQVAEVIRKTHLFKPNCALVIIDFLFRHGYVYSFYSFCLTTFTYIHHMYMLKF